MKAPKPYHVTCYISNSLQQRFEDIQRNLDNRLNCCITAHAWQTGTAEDSSLGKLFLQYGGAKKQHIVSSM